MVSVLFKNISAFLFIPVLLAVRMPASGQASLQAAIDALARSPEMKHGAFGVCVYDVESGEMIAGYEPDLSLMPASALKVVTTATALAVLGPDYRYSTVLEFDGAVREGRLEGNLVIRGSGDPTLGSDQLDATAGLEKIMEEFRLAVQRHGIRQIDGAVIGDGTYLPTSVTAPSWQWNDLGNYYAAGVWGLNIHENLYYLRFKQAAQLGATPGIAAVEPAVPGIEFHNEVISAGSRTGDNAYIFGGPYTFERFVRGTIPVGSSIFSIKGSIPNPPLFAAQHLNMALEKIGVISAAGARDMIGIPAGERPGAARTVLYTHQSPPLSAIVFRANQKSVNLYCESLLRTIGKERKNDGSLDAGLDAVAELWRERGLSLDGVHLRDGSGLSARNGVTARFLAGLLRKASLEQRIFQPLYDSFPAYGGSQYDLRAKSGTLDRVRTFAGYARNRSGKLLAFAIIANNFEGSGGAMRSRLQQLMLEICKF